MSCSFQLLALVLFPFSVWVSETYGWFCLAIMNDPHIVIAVNLHRRILKCQIVFTDINKQIEEYRLLPMPWQPS